MNYELVQWQKIDPTNGLVFPWFTHPFLEVLMEWDLKDKYVLEYGGGRSTAWWRVKSNTVVTIEVNAIYRESIREECREKRLGNGLVIFKDVTEADRSKEAYYVKSHEDWIGNFPFDIVVVDAIFRYECMIEGIAILSKNNGGRLIVDNWQQDGFICPACADLVKDFEGHVYRQMDHTDHHGNPWQTAYWEIPKTNICHTDTK